ncbi:MULTISPECIES: spherulation-specific family 4 protein [Nitrosomonas]|uniref:Spherulation-specific family 4 protein n=1 Tax=Nitrosomonas communis TaxID=44574 RepID=A0A5D3YAI3_9PROT|nr:MULTISPECIES: spherulation-specific family 4 protein [Nitrosomonas]TYP78555.1 spherulation-specific family 4 protein [Nitrosomonas communis]UVS60084.1 spherulation-specific family 4 protein [Nitrosomonas sp. PLL12]
MSIKHLFFLSAVYLSVAFSANIYATNLFVPAYFHPSDSPTLDYWGGLAAAAQIVPTTAILNPDNGFGTSVDPDYVKAIDQVHASGGKVIAYVFTSYGDRPLIDIAIEIDNYIAFYTIDGFFIDEMASDGTDENLMYYEQIYNYIKNKSSHYSVTGAPGVVPDEIYLSKPVADNLVVFEDSMRNYINFKPAQWQQNYPKDRFIHIVYNATWYQMIQAFSQTDKNYVGSLYITDDNFPNPYDSLPQYRELEVEMAIVPPNKEQKIFIYAEQLFPQYFSLANEDNQQLDGFIYRYYSTTNAYIGIKNGDVFVLGDSFGPSIRRIDTIENTLQLLESAAGS